MLSHSMCVNCSRSYLPAQSRAASSRLHRAGIVTVYIIPNAFEDSIGNVYLHGYYVHKYLIKPFEIEKQTHAHQTSHSNHRHILSRMLRCTEDSTAPSGALTPIHNKLLYQLISPLRTTTGAPNSPCSHKGKVGTISRLGFLCKKI